MREINQWWPRLVVLALLALILAAPFVMQLIVGPTKPLPHASGDVSSTWPQAGEEIIVITPHNDQIRYEFAHAFNRWRRRANRMPVWFDWRSSSGTSDLRRQVVSQFTRLVREGQEDAGIGVDLFFGGGHVEHNTLARGLTIKRNGRMEQVPLTIRINLSPNFFTEVFPDATIGGEPLYHNEWLWVGTTLSSFGIIWNKDVLPMLDGLTRPRSWADLRDVRYRGWLAVADPAHSGSIAATYNAIIQRKGWNEGWVILRRVFANARYFAASASKVPLDTAAGEAAAGMCIDFYGRYQAAALGNDRIEYVDPRLDVEGLNLENLPLETAVTADPISILRGAPHADLALEFVRWVLSKDGQRIWQRRAGVPGGPKKHELRRLPIRQDMYVDEEMRHWRDQVRPFEVAKPLPSGMPSFYKAVAPVAHALGIDVHDDLKAAWAAIVNHPNHQRRNEMLAKFDAMPDGTDDSGQDMSLTVDWPDAISGKDVARILNDPSQPLHDDVVAVIKGFAERLKARYTRSGSKRSWDDGDKLLRHRLAWTRFFRNNYREIVRIARTPSDG